MGANTKKTLPLILVIDDECKLHGIAEKGEQVRTNLW